MYTSWAQPQYPYEAVKPSAVPMVRQPLREAQVSVLPPPTYGMQPFGQKPQLFAAGVQKPFAGVRPLEVTLGSTTASTLGGTASTLGGSANVSRRVSDASAASMMDPDWLGVSRRVSAGSTMATGDVSRFVSEAASVRSHVLSDSTVTRIDTQPVYPVPPQPGSWGTQVAVEEKVFSGGPLVSADIYNTEPPLKTTPKKRVEERNSSKDSTAQVRRRSSQHRTERSPRRNSVDGGEVVWAGAGAEKRSSNAGARDRSEDRGPQFSVRSPRKSVPVEESAHGSLLPHHCNGIWQASLCEHKVYEDKAPVQIDSLSRSERPGFDLSASARSSRSESARPRRSSTGGMAAPGADDKKPTTRALVTTLFGEVPERTLSTPRQRASEFTDVHGHTKIGYMNDNSGPNSARGQAQVPAQCVPRKYMREVVDASGRAWFHITDGPAKPIERSQSQQQQRARSLTPQSRPTRVVNVARGDIVDPFGSRRNFIVDKGIAPTVLGYPACVQASPRIRGRR